MKKIAFLFFIVLISSTFILKNQSGGQYDGEFDVGAKSIIVINEDNGKTLYEKNSSEQLPIASMSKLMTQYIVLKAIQDGKLSWEHTYEPSEAVLEMASLSGAAKLNMAAGHLYTVKELFTAATVNSSNDAAVALAELVGGDEATFVQMMNEEATKLRMNQTIFYNATGLDGHHIGKSMEETNLSSAQDLATLSRTLLREYPEILEFTQMTNFESSAGVNIWSSNLMLPGMPHGFSGIDGLKTGYTELAGLCFASTGIFNDQRFITVVMDVEDNGNEANASRFYLTRELIEKVILQ